MALRSEEADKILVRNDLNLNHSKGRIIKNGAYNQSTGCRRIAE